jgi:hypothetical protein
MFQALINGSAKSNAQNARRGRKRASEKRFMVRT